MANPTYTTADDEKRSSHSSHAGTDGDPDLSPEDIVDALADVATQLAAIQAAIVAGGALPAGGATAANQTTANTSLGNLDTKLGEVQASPTANTVLDRLKAIATALAGTLTVAAHAVTQSGVWNITNISGTVSLPTGAATAANQSTANTSLGNLDTKLGEVQASPTANTVLDRLKAIATALSGTLTVAAHAVTQSGTWNITNVSGTVSLPTGAATAAKQPALGTAGTPSTDVLTVQGATSMTPLKTDASATTQPISVASLPLPTGAATAANQTTANTSLGNLDTKLGEVQANPTANTVLDRLKAIATVLAGTLTVATHAVTQSGAWTVTIGAFTAGETHLGEVAGSGKGVKVALTVTASSAYAAGNAIGGKITIANAVRVSGGVSVLSNLTILDRANVKPTGTLFIFDADPTAATITDKTAVTFSTDDLKVVAAIPIGNADYTTANSKAFANLSNLARVVQAATGTTLYAVWVASSTPTFAATSDVQLIFDFVYVN